MGRSYKRAGTLFLGLSWLWGVQECELDRLGLVTLLRLLGVAANPLTLWFTLPTAGWVPEPAAPSYLGEDSCLLHLG